MAGLILSWSFFFKLSVTLVALAYAMCFSIHFEEFCYNVIFSLVFRFWNFSSLHSLQQWQLNIPNTLHLSPKLFVICKLWKPFNHFLLFFFWLLLDISCLTNHNIRFKPYKITKFAKFGQPISFEFARFNFDEASGTAYISLWRCKSPVFFSFRHRIFVSFHVNFTYFS